MARPRSHRYPLKPYESSAVQKLFERLRRENRWKAGDVKAFVERASLEIDSLPDEEIYEGYTTDIFLAEDYTYNRVIREGFGKRDGLIKAFFLLFHKKYYNVISKEIFTERMKVDEPFAQAAHKIMRGSELDDYSVPKRFLGSYSLYRPSPFAPESEIFCCNLVIGSELSDFDLKFETSNHDQTGRGIVAIGKIMPDQGAYGRLNAFAAVPEGDGQISFHFDRIDRYSNGKSVSMRGIMMAGLGSDKASAWPVYAICDPSVPMKPPERLTEENLPSSFKDEILEELARGMVHWERKYTHESRLT